MYASVLLDVPHSKLDRTFDYAVPDGLDISVGSRVIVPFGPSSKSEQGIVLSLSVKTDYAGRVKAIAGAPDEFPVVTPAQIALAREMAKKYHTPLCVPFRLMYPAELRGMKVKRRVKRIISLADGADTEALIKGCYTKNGVIRSLNRLNLISVLRVSGKIEFSSLNDGMKAAARKALSDGWALMVFEENYRRPERLAAPNAEVELTAGQLSALGRIRGGRYLLHGVTGSGKTEVYIGVIRSCLKEGKSAILLAPEISLTPQLIMMLERRLQSPISVLHSSLSAGERFDEWRRIVSGEAKIIVGARSAVFAPASNLGVIIIDEEHESSYKSDQHPKYTAHDVAKMRTRIEGCALVLGSATPSVETYYEARSGGYEIIELNSRMFSLPLPEVAVADMRKELAAGNRSIFSARLYAELEKTLGMGRQAMLFINRRGYSTFVMCRGCGYTEYCDECEVTMTYHASPGVLKCHYCGRTREPRKICPKCGKPYLKYFGVGTQKVEEEVRAAFPLARVLRMDLDTCGKKGAHLKIYKSFANGEADILIGTQMIAKGLDFEGVRTVGVVAADTSLKFPNYRSAERTFALIEQVSGRAGRKDHGVVVVQTYSPSHYAVERAAAHDYRGFYDDEIARRREYCLPPFGVYYRILFSGPDDRITREECARFKSSLNARLAPYAEAILLNQMSEAAVRRIDGKYRYQIMIKARKRPEIEDEILNFMEDYECKVAFGLDINP